MSHMHGYDDEDEVFARGHMATNYDTVCEIAEVLGVDRGKDLPTEVKRLKDEVAALRRKLDLDEAKSPLHYSLDVVERELRLLYAARAPITMIAELANPLEVAPPFGPRGNLVIVKVPDNCFIGVLKEKP